jgi:hypothetical protein
MISCNLRGGIGNQLFQIAATHALALRHNDISGFDLDICSTPNQGNESSKYKDNILSNLPKIDYVNYNFKNYYFEQKFSYDEIPYKEELLINGYFQSELYFKDYKKEIINLFNISNENKNIVKEFFNFIGLVDKPITSIHIRRGDYLKHPDFHPVCPIEYYNKAIEYIGDSYFVFISDDMVWVKNNFKGNDYFYSNFNDEILDLTLQTQCDNNIIANSSFSWWGAYLNQNIKKKVITPKNWFGKNGPQDTEDLIPKNWIIL